MGSVALDTGAATGIGGSRVLGTESGYVISTRQRDLYLRVEREEGDVFLM